MSDVMERLERANPVPSGAPPEGHDADALLERIVATPVEPRRRRAPRPRRLVPAVALAAVVAIAVFVAIDLIDAERGGSGIAERAVAATSAEDAVYAVVVRQTLRLTPRGGGPTDVSRAYLRGWLWRGGDQSRWLDYAVRPDGTPGRLRYEIALDGNTMRWWDPETNQLDVIERGPPGDAPAAEGDFPGFDPYLDPARQLREHVDDGALREAGRVIVRGRTAYRLVAERVTYLVDARTYLLLEVRERLSTPDETGAVRIEYLRYARLPVTDATRARLRMAPHPGAQVHRSGD